MIKYRRFRQLSIMRNARNTPNFESFYFTNKYPDPMKWLTKKIEWDDTKEILFSKQKRRISSIIQKSKDRFSVSKDYSHHNATLTIKPRLEELKEKLRISLDLREPRSPISRKKLCCMLNYKKTNRINGQEFKKYIINPLNNSITYK